MSSYSVNLLKIVGVEGQKLCTNQIEVYTFLMRYYPCFDIVLQIIIIYIYYLYSLKLTYKPKGLCTLNNFYNVTQMIVTMCSTSQYNKDIFN